MNDTELIQQTLQGNPIAFGRLMERYYDRVLLYTASLLRDYFEAEEVTQDAFLRGYHRLRELKDPNSFLPWMIRIAHNMALKRLRRRRDFQVIPIEELEEEIPDERSFEDELLREEAEGIFYEAMEGLDAEDRGMLWGRLSGESYRELSKRYGKSVGAVKMRVRRAKEKVREKVLRRLSCVVMGPWREIIEVIGGVVMKATTKVAITGVAVIMLAGVGIWLSYHREEKPVPESNEVKVERRATVGAPARVTVGNPKPKEKEDELTFEEFNRLLDEYFGITSEIESTVPEEKMTSPEEKMSSASDEIAEEQPIGETHKENPQREETDELKQMEIDMVKAEITELMLENGRIWRRLEELSQMERHGLHVDPKEVEQLIIARREMGTKIFPKIARYTLLTGDTKATYPGGWIYELGQKNHFFIKHGSL